MRNSSEVTVASRLHKPAVNSSPLLKKQIKKHEKALSVLSFCPMLNTTKQQAAPISIASISTAVPGKDL